MRITVDLEQLPDGSWHAGALDETGRSTAALEDAAGDAAVSAVRRLFPGEDEAAERIEAAEWSHGLAGVGPAGAVYCDADPCL